MRFNILNFVAMTTNRETTLCSQI